MASTTRTGVTPLVELERLAAGPLEIRRRQGVQAIEAVLNGASEMDARSLRRARALLGRIARRTNDVACGELAGQVAEQLRARQRELEWNALSADAAKEAELLRDRAVALLRDGPLRPSALAEQLGVSDPEVVRALRPLRAAGRVDVREEGPAGTVPDGRARWYWLVPSDTEAISEHEVRDLLERYKATATLIVEAEGKRFRLPEESIELLRVRLAARAATTS